MRPLGLSILTRTSSQPSTSAAFVNAMVRNHKFTLADSLRTVSLVKASLVHSLLMFDECIKKNPEQMNTVARTMV